MGENLLIGSAVIALTVVIQTFGLILLAGLMPLLIRWLRLHRHYVGKSFAMVATVLGLFLLHTVEVWAWAIVYLSVNAVGDFEDALYFSTGAFSTAGQGEPLVSHSWRILASLESIDGFLLIGWSIAFLVAASTRSIPLGRAFLREQ